MKNVNVNLSKKRTWDDLVILSEDL